MADARTWPKARRGTASRRRLWWPDVRTLTACGLGLAAFALYLTTIGPTITWRNGGTDSGDVATAAAVLGIPHPPGYPLFTVVAHLATRALPWVEPAMAVNLLCAGLSATAVAAVALASGRSALGQMELISAAGAAAIVGTGRTWWEQATHATPHAANLAFTAVLCLAAGRVLAGRCAARTLGWSAFASGLAVSHHLTLLAVPAAVLIAGACDVGGWRARLAPGVGAGRAIRAVGVGFGLGLTPWLGLPVIAAAQPPYMWGDPTTAAGLADLLLGRQYAELVGLGGPADVLGRLAIGVRLLAAGLGPVGVLGALVGAALAWDDRRSAVVVVAVLAILDLGFFALYPVRDVPGYLLPTVVFAAPLVARGLAGTAELAGRRFGAWVAGGLAGLAVALQLVWGWRAVDISQDTAARDFAATALGAAPDRAVLVAASDEQTFALWYAHTALGLRPDVVVVDERMLVWPWYRALVARLQPDLAPALAAGDPGPGWRTRVARPVVVPGPP